MTTYIFDLGPLEDIQDTLVFEDEPSIFCEEHAVDLVETALHLMEEFMFENPTAISEPNFHDILLEEIKEMFYVQMEDHILESDYIEDDMNDLLEDAFNIYITTFHPERSMEQKIINSGEEDDNELENYEENIIQAKIQGLRDIPQPVQRTPEWYQFRWNLITASNAWKAFESQSTINQLIYEKCQPLKDFNTEPIDDEPTKMVNTNTTLHWGQKYEPLSVMLYEQMYDSKVEDFGCIQHPNYKFIGASPDGIVIESNTGRYGRMLEIKNIVNREINGIPKKEYWVQMQLQMEVCDLDECDFLETKFIEYQSASEFIDDRFIDEEIGDENLTLSKDKKMKGIILHFHTKEGAPFYSYKPLDIVHNDDIKFWEETELEKYESEPYNYTFLRFIYWKLEKLSCVLVLRNREWFKNNVGQLEKVWKIIEEERVTGYEHRAPNKKPKKEQISKPYITQNNANETCFLKVVKLDN
jgi:putative phage-type endonuclease